MITACPAPHQLRCEHLATPLGLDEPEPRLSWKLPQGRPGLRQAGYQVRVAASFEALSESGKAEALRWDSEQTLDATSHLVPYLGPALRPHTRYWWKVRVWDESGNQSEWSEITYWETGFMGAGRWPGAQWIESPLGKRGAPAPVRQLRRCFNLDGVPRQARLYVTARGLFECYINGERIGDDVLAPGWTDYNQRTEYLSYDVGTRLRLGENVIGALLAEGWFCGDFGPHEARNNYGDEPALLAVLRIEEANGAVHWIGTDREWRGAAGAILAADLYQGEIYDATELVHGWTEPGFVEPSPGWRPAQPVAVPTIELNGKASAPIRAMQELPAVGLTEPKPRIYIFDVGQNMVGVARLRVRAARGTRVTLRFGEMLQADGTLYTENLRSARCTDEYVCNGEPVEEWTPRFTFHGFRYVEVTGLQRRPRLSAITGIVWHSALDECGGFSCSHPLVNRLHGCIQWGQRGNFLDVPTDCPQRNERLGWTGDAQAFATTAAFNFESTAFYRKWLRDLADAQLPDGAVPDVAPDLLSSINARRGGRACGGNAGWGDAQVIVPWVLYETSGDARLLSGSYSAMEKWMGFQERTSRGGLRPETAYGDWLATEAVKPEWAPTPCDLIGTAYFAHTAGIMMRVALVLGRKTDSRRYAALRRRVVAAFLHEYVSPAGRVAGDTQTGYLLALGFDLLPKSLRPAAIANLERALSRRDHHLSTGFLGTPLLCPVLTQCGRPDLAYRMLLNEDYPSWLFPVKNGATTMWERWNSWTPDAGFGPVAMNSFNHYAYGAVGEWLHRIVAGIAPDSAGAGYRQIRFAPLPGGGLTRAAAWHESPYGRIESSWELSAKRLVWSVTVPPNSAGTAFFPVSRRRDVRVMEGKLRWTDSREQRAVAAQLAPGNYRFEITRPLLVPTRN